MKIKLYKSFTKELMETWKKIDQSNRLTVFQHLDWQKNWFKYIGEKQNYKLNIIIVEDAKKNKILLPFCIKTKLGIKILTFIGGNQTDYFSAIYSEKLNINNNIWNKIEGYLDYYDLIEIPNLINFQFNKFFLPMKNPIVNISEISNYAILESTWEKQKLKLRKKLIKDTSRQIKRLKAIGHLEFNIINFKDANYEKFLKIFFEQKENRYKKTGAFNNFYYSEIKNFYKNTADLAGSNTSIQFSTLKLNNQIIATHWGAYDNRTFYYLMPTFSYKWERYSPGTILLEFLIRWCIDEKKEVFDFTIGSENYKKEWCDNQLELNEFISPKSYKGYIYSVFKKFKKDLKKIPIFITIIQIFRKFKAKSF